MPDTTENNLTDSLGLEVDALLADMAAACDRLQQQLGDAPPSPASSREPQPPVPPVAASPMDGTPASATAAAPASTASDSLSNDDLSSLVAEMNRELPIPEPEAASVSEA